ncbi:MAG: hypothetical protein ACKOEO_09915 [Planctomycetaceae bacterium]
MCIIAHLPQLRTGTGPNAITKSSISLANGLTPRTAFQSREKRRNRVPGRLPANVCRLADVYGLGDVCRMQRQTAPWTRGSAVSAAAKVNSAKSAVDNQETCLAMPLLLQASPQ